tara:strand:+ start:23938 stop:24108 length:171 start_codon:yes stop_codon:yes gene_type:complete
MLIYRSKIKRLVKKESLLALDLHKAPLKGAFQESYVVNGSVYPFMRKKRLVRNVGF